MGSLLNICVKKIIEDETKNKEGFINLIPAGIRYFLCENKKEANLKDISVEIINTILYIGIYYFYEFNIYMVKYCLLFSIMLIMSVIDIKTKNIYFKISVFGMISAASIDVYEYIVFHKSIMNYIYGGFIAFVIFLLIVKFTSAMGDGDIEVALMCGLFLGVKHIMLVILLSFIIGGIAGCILLISKQKSRKYEMAFVPYLTVGVYIAVFWGDKLIDWYLKSY